MVKSDEKELNEGNQIALYLKIETNEKNTIIYMNAIV